MEPQFLKQLAQNKPQGAPSDYNAPFSYLEWKLRRPSINERDAVYHYNRYLIEWFETNKERKVSKQFVLRQRYLYLLSQLQVYFSEEERNNWYNKINLADEKELLLAIPFFARKLKDISLYYLKLRKQLKNTKLKYNTIGSHSAIERELESYFLKTFTTENLELSTSIQQQLPTFQELKDSLSIEVEELYDDKSYQDHSDTMPLSAYYNLADEATSEFFATKGITLSSADWLFTALNIPVTASVEAYTVAVTGDIFEIPESTLYGAFIGKYLAEDKYSLAVTNVSASIDVTQVDLQQGNNYFYYPYGVVDTSLSIPRKLITVPLSSLLIEGSTPGDDIKTGDVIFVKNGDSLKSAWLYDRVYDESSIAMNARLKTNTTTSFIFPYPGYGLSGQNFEWTGPSTSSNGEYNFLSREYKTAVNSAYWSQTLSGDSCDSILLNNTTLISGAPYASNNPLFSDQVYLRERSTESSNSQVGSLGAWLYKFEKTAIPIDSNQSNVVLWPYTTVSPKSALPYHLQNINYRNACMPVRLQDFNTSHGIAGAEFDYADKIYKLNKFSDTFQQATECVWLSSGYDRVGDVQFAKQDGFNASFEAGTALRFVWTGPNNSPLNSVFSTIRHADNCVFSSNFDSLSALDWQQCTCKQVYYTPLGHPGRTFKDYNAIADCIVEENNTILEEFDFGSWIDEGDQTITNSQKFAWYRTYSKHSWGDGRWVSSDGTSQPFTLKYGKTYIYRRSNNGFGSTNLPHYSISYAYGSNNAVWKKARKSEGGVWYGLSASAPSEMVFYPGDFFVYDRQPYTTSALISSEIVLGRPENRGSIWSSIDYVVVDPALSNNSGSTAYPTTIQRYLQTVYVSWPTETAPLGITDPQYPPYSLTSLSAISAWDIIYDQDPTKRTRLYKGSKYTLSQPSYGQVALPGSWYSSDVSGFSFTPYLTGTYTIQVTAIAGGSGQVFAFTNIPKVTAVNVYQEEEKPITFETDSTGFLIEQPLLGWNYNTNSPSRTGEGARPYWAVLYSEKNPTTQSKGIYSWGYPYSYINNYLPNKHPQISPLNLEFGTVVEYFRKGFSFDWAQPITYKTYVGKPLWCQLSAVTTNGSPLSAVFASETRPDFITYPQKTTTDIELSNLLNGRPVEIFYYATNSFTWNVSVEVLETPPAVEPAMFFSSATPWANLPNRFFPTIAQVPVLEEIYSESDVGGYFIPQNLGASQYLNKNFTATLSTNNLSGTFLGEDVNIHVGGRGHSKQDQATLYTWNENNEWLKESSTTERLAGAVKKPLTKALQTFIPYQQNDDETPLGLINTKSRLTPWGGPYKDTWTDSANEPKSFTGVRNVSAWADTQVLKRNEEVLDYWTTDVHGNQYGLFKDLFDIPVVERKNVYGELWTRTNNQMVFPAAISLSSVFQNMADERQNQSLFLELTGRGIKSIDCFFDTLMIETSSALCFAQIDYDYEDQILESPVDFIRGITLNEKLRYEQTWFFTEIKKAIVLLTSIDSNSGTFVPRFYDLDLEVHTLQEIFPVTETESNNFVNSLDGFTFKELSRASIHYNPSSLKFLVTYTGLTDEDKPFVINITVNAYENYSFEKVKIYVDQPTNVFCLPPIFTSPRFVTAGNGMNFSLQGIASNNPDSWKILSFSNHVSATNTGTVFGNFPNIGVYDVNIELQNKCGVIRDSITFNIIDQSMLPTPGPTPTMAPPTPTPDPTSTPAPTPTPSSSPGPTPTPSSSPGPTPTPTITPGAWCVEPGTTPATVNILNVYSAALPPESGYSRLKACYRCVTLTVNANGDVTNTSQSGATCPNNLNLANIIINNGLVPSTQGVYTYVFEFFGWRKQGVYQTEPPGWYCADDEYGIWTEPSTASLLSLTLTP